MRLRKKTFLLITFGLLLLSPRHTRAQKLATFEADLSGTTTETSFPVSVALDNITMLNQANLSLLEISGNARKSTPFQVSDGELRLMTWIVTPDKKSKRTYELVKTNSIASPKNTLVAVKDNGMLTIESGNKKLLRYYYGTVYPPAGVDSAYRRSGFIHPLWSPKGQVLTRIQPKDHYHHYGIWNPWTHVLFEGDTVDFWNIRGKQATVRFANFVSTTNGLVFAEFKAVHEHVVFKKDKTEKVAINELQTVRVYVPENDRYFLVDITSQMNCASNSPVRLLEYRYGGLGWRTTEKWDNKNSEVLTSEGKTRKDSDGTTARWVIVQGAIDDEYAGAVMLSYPTNYNYPEPIRIWPENQYDRGDMFANFSPTKNKDWLLEPGKIYTLKYRLVVFNGHFNKEKAEEVWKRFANTPVVTIKK